MMGIFGVVRSYVLADAAIASMIGTRFYPIRTPQGSAYPVVTMQKIVEVRFPHLRGRGDLAAPRYQVDAWVKETGGAAAFTQVQQLAELIRRRVDGFSGVLTDAAESPPASWQVSILFDDCRDLFEPDVTGGFYRTSTDFVIWHRPVTS